MLVSKAKYGILIKDGQTIEVSDKVDSVLLDKTGTITLNQMSVKETDIYNEKMFEYVEYVM